MGIFDAINNYSTQVANSKPTGWTTAQAPAYQNLGVVSQTYSNPVPSTLQSAGFLIANNRYLGKNPAGAYAVDFGPASTTVNQQGILGPNSTGWQGAYDSQNSYLTGALGNVNAYSPSSSYYTAPTYASMEAAINNSYGQASQSYSNLAPNIKALVEKYAVNPNLFPDQELQNKALADSYTRAKAQYDQVNLPADALTAPSANGISNLNQIYGAARNQFNEYTDAGNMAINKLKNIQSGDPNAIDNVINNPIIQMQLNQGLKAVNQSASAQGMLRSGQTLKQLQQLGIANAGNALQQYQQNLLNTASLGNAAGGSIAGLYAQQNAAEMERAKQLGLIDTTGAQAVASNKVAQATAQQNAIQAQQEQELKALGLSQTNAAALAKLLTEQSAAATAEHQKAYENNAAASQATFLSKDAANRAYLAQVLALTNAQSNAAAQNIYGQNTSAQYRVI